MPAARSSGPGGLARAEGLLGLALPDDYKALAETYGVGWFSEWLMADLPDSPYPQFDLLHGVQETVEWRRSCRDERPGTILYAFHPEPSGLDPLWGKTNTRVSLSWHTDGPDPDAWPVVLFDDVDWVNCGRGFLDILLDHLTGRDPLQGLIGFSPAWPPRWQPMRRREMQSPTTAPEQCS